MAMTKDYMDRVLRWHQVVCPLEVALCMIQKKMNGAQPSDVHLDIEMRKRLTQHLKQITLAANGWTLWTRCDQTCPCKVCDLTYHIRRCFELIKLQRKDIQIDTVMLDGVLKSYLAHQPLTMSDRASHFEIFLSNRKGWQKKVDKGQWEVDLRCKLFASIRSQQQMTKQHHQQITTRYTRVPRCQPAIRSSGR